MSLDCASVYFIVRYCCGEKKSVAQHLSEMVAGIYCSALVENEKFAGIKCRTNEIVAKFECPRNIQKSSRTGQDNIIKHEE